VGSWLLHLQINENLSVGIETDLPQGAFSIPIVEGKKRFEEVIQNKEIPAEIPEITPMAYDIVTVLTQGKLVKSKSEARQVIVQGGVKINDQKVEAIDAVVKAGDIVQKGNRFFVKVK
jgi:tyrosyl-tRNA synthetase